jgi:hypothetical protein
LILKKSDPEYRIETSSGTCQVVPMASAGLSSVISNASRWMRRILFPCLIVKAIKTSRLYYIVPSLLTQDHRRRSYMLPVCPDSGLPLESELNNEEFLILTFHFCRLRIYKVAWRYAKSLSHIDCFSDHVVELAATLLGYKDQTAALVMIKMHIMYQTYFNSLVFDWNAGTQFFPHIDFSLIINQYFSRINLAPSYISSSLPPVLSLFQLQDMMNYWLQCQKEGARASRRSSTAARIEIFSELRNLSYEVKMNLDFSGRPPILDFSKFSDDLNIFNVDEAKAWAFASSCSLGEKTQFAVRVLRLLVLAFGLYASRGNAFNAPEFLSLKHLVHLYHQAISDDPKGTFTTCWRLPDALPKTHFFSGDQTGPPEIEISHSLLPNLFEDIDRTLAATGLQSLGKMANLDAIVQPLLDECAAEWADVTRRDKASLMGGGTLMPICVTTLKEPFRNFWLDVAKR